VRGERKYGLEKNLSYRKEKLLQEVADCCLNANQRKERKKEREEE
jgi:hypothetical protein